MKNQYPDDDEIKVEWTKIHTIIIVTVTAIVLCFLAACSGTITKTKLLSTAGLYIDIVGVVITTLKTPFYGIFHDGGQIEFKRQRVEHKYFRAGMYLIVVGMVLQLAGTLLT